MVGKQKVLDAGELKPIRTGKNSVGIDYGGKALLDIAYDERAGVIRVYLHNEHLKVVIENKKR